MSEQFDFDFQTSSCGMDSLAAWRANRARQIEHLCRRLGVPIGRRAEVRLKQGPPLTGLLRLAEEQLWNDPERENVVLEIGNVTFRLAEIESVLRSDA